MFRRALISVSDKTGIVEIAQSLVQENIEILATGGTARLLQDHQIPVRDVSEITGFPEMMDGRVKTLHPAVHGALLADRQNPEHMQQIEKHCITPIDLLIVNLYPFEQVTRKPDVSLEESIENIDIGGPAMIRSAAKNFRHVCVVTDPADYPMIREFIQRHESVPSEIRQKLMVKAFDHTSRYDRRIADYFQHQFEKSDETPSVISLSLRKHYSLRYGENPHQKAAFYLPSDREAPGFHQVHGKELSYNNLLDMDACVRLLTDFPQPVCVIIKHNNPCGVATGETAQQAFEKARSTDPQAAFGGIIGFNRPVDEPVALALHEMFVEVILSPAFTPEALSILRKKKNLRLIVLQPDQFKYPAEALSDIRPAMNGYLLQVPDRPVQPETSYTIASHRSPSELERRSLLLGWTIVRHVKSNAIVISNHEQTLGIGAGQMSRVDAVKLAILKAREAGLCIQGAALASDAFFPFRDNIDEAAKAGITAIIQPGGSVNDEQVRSAVNEYGMTMILTHERHFRH